VPFRTSPQPRTLLGPLADRPANPDTDGIVYVSPTKVSVYDAVLGWIDAGGGGGATTEFIFNSAGPSDPIKGLYNNWITLCDAILTLPFGALPRIVFTNAAGETIPSAGQPPNGWYMGMGSWVAPTFNTGNVTVTIADGAMIDSLSMIAEGLAVTAAPSADGVFNWFTYSSSHPMAPWILSVQYGASLFNGSLTGKALIGPTPGVGQFVVLASAAATLTSSVPPPPAPLLGPFLKLTAGDVAIGSQMEPGFYGNLPDGWISGDGNLLYQNGTDARTPSTPGFIGTIFPLSTFQQVLNPLAQKGARRQLVYTNVAPTESQTDVFDDWAALYAVWSSLDDPKDIVFQPAAGILHIPSAGMPLGGWVIGRGNNLIGRGIGGPTTVEIDAGAVLVDVTYLGGSLSLISSSPSPSLDFSVGHVGPLLVLDAGSSLRNNALAGPMIAWTRNDNLNIGLREYSSMSTGPSLAPIVDVTPSGGFASQCIIYQYDGSVGAYTLSGSDAGGTAMMTFMVGNGQIDLNQPAWTPPSWLLSSQQAFQVQSRPRTNIQTDPVIAGSTYNITNGSEFVRIAPAAPFTPIVVILPDATLFPDETVFVKKTTADMATPITVQSVGGLIDGAAADPWPPVGFFARRYTSDGVDWWIS